MGTEAAAAADFGPFLTPWGLKSILIVDN